MKESRMRRRKRRREELREGKKKSYERKKIQHNYSYK